MSEPVVCSSTRWQRLQLEKNHSSFARTQGLRKGSPTLAYFLHYITFSFLAAKQHVGLELGEDGLHALPHGALEGAPARQSPAGARALVSERPQGAQARGGKEGGDEPCY